MVTSEGAFSYLARDLGLKELYLWPINADQQGTPQQVRKVVDIVKKIISRQSLARVRFPINQRVRLRVKPARTTVVCSMSIPEHRKRPGTYVYRPSEGYYQYAGTGN